MSALSSLSSLPPPRTIGGRLAPAGTYVPSSTSSSSSSSSSSNKHSFAYLTLRNIGLLTAAIHYIPWSDSHTPTFVSDASNALIVSANGTLTGVNGASFPGGPALASAFLACTHSASVVSSHVSSAVSHAIDTAAPYVHSAAITLAPYTSDALAQLTTHAASEFAPLHAPKTTYTRVREESDAALEAKLRANDWLTQLYDRVESIVSRDTFDDNEIARAVAKAKVPPPAEFDVTSTPAYTWTWRHSTYYHVIYRVAFIKGPIRSAFAAFAHTGGSISTWIVSPEAAALKQQVERLFTGTLDPSEYDAFGGIENARRVAIAVACLVATSVAASIAAIVVRVKRRARSAADFAAQMLVAKTAADRDALLQITSDQYRNCTTELAARLLKQRSKDGTTA